MALLGIDCAVDSGKMGVATSVLQDGKVHVTRGDGFVDLLTSVEPGPRSSSQSTLPWGSRPRLGRRLLRTGPAGRSIPLRTGSSDGRRANERQAIANM